MTKEEKTFIRTLEDLSNIINTEDDHKILLASGYIRKLFFDGNRLFIVVNQVYHLKIEFEYVNDYNDFLVNYPSNLPKPSGFLAIESIDPYQSKNPNIMKADSDNFFKTIIGSFDNQVYTIKDLIKFLANVEGGIHVGTPRKDIEKMLDTLNNHPFFSMFSLPILLHQLRAITKIILKALRPLVHEILKLKKFDDKLGIGVHLLITLYPEKDKKDNYILDFGIEENKNRLSIFVNANDQLCMRFFDENNIKYQIIGGKVNSSFLYNIPMYLAFEIASHNGELLMSIDTGIWRRTYLFKSSSNVDAIDKKVFVIGSDYNGKATTNIGILRYLLVDAVLSPEDKQKIIQELNEMSKDGSIRFEGNCFLKTDGHPNFLEKS